MSGEQPRECDVLVAEGVRALTIGLRETPGVRPADDRQEQHRRQSELAEELNLGGVGGRILDMRRRSCPNGEGKSDSGKDTSAATTSPTISPNSPDTIVWAETWDIRVRKARIGRVVRNGVIIRPVRAPTRAKMLAHSSTGPSANRPR